MKKLLYILFGFLFICNAYAAQIVNVEYIHNLISQEWDITVPYNPALTDVKTIANMKYLLTAVDVANEILNGEKTSNYGNTEFATTRIADTTATIQAVETLVKQNKIEYKFFMDIDLSRYDDNGNHWGGGTATITEFGFDISAAGTFYIDWGDGTTETIKKADTNPVTYSHDYGTATGVFRVGIGGQATDYSDNTYSPVLNFYVTAGPMSEFAQAITNIDGSLGAIFGTLADGSQPSFCYMFDSTSGVKKIPDNLFKGIHGDLVDGMFQNTFSFCPSLTGPSARIDGLYLYEIWPDATEEQVGGMYTESSGLSDYESIPITWGGLGATTNEYPSAPSDAVYDFYLTTTSDTDMFAMQISAAGEFYIDWGDGKTEWITKSDTTIKGFVHKYASKGAYNIKLGGQATAYNTDSSTAAISFYVNSSQTKIASIDGSLGAIFGTLSSDTNNQPLFHSTFSGASNMTGSIPSDLFAGISGAPADYMFNRTFYGCSGLTSIPAGLFANLTGAPASFMFYGTFAYCTGLTSIHAGLFAGICDAPASSMFQETFYGCSKLTSIPENLFGNISGTAKDYMFYQTFTNCTSLTGPSARINGKYLYEIWPSATTSQVGDMYRNATGLSDYLHIPVAWGGLGATTNEYPSAPSDAVYDFYLTTTSDTDMFAMKISAAGEFYIDWGDGKSERITKSDTTKMTFGHKYASNGAYNIRLGGQATAYSTSTNTAAISFYVNPSQQKIASIDGSLGAIFGTLSSDTNNQPRFSGTFSGATNMTGSIPAGLFAGISGAPASAMFQNTFNYCSGLTGAIPDGLFGNLTGKPASNMFDSTFRGCSGLTGAIPDGLFGNLTGAPASYMFASTFYGCSGLTGAIPDGLFAGISGAPAWTMFSATFYGCSGLTSIPENLFGNISGTAQYQMFDGMFMGCTSLTGPSARINGQYLYEIWPTYPGWFYGAYIGCTGLSDFSTMPTMWKTDD